MGDKCCLAPHQFVVLSDIAQISLREELGQDGDEFWCVFSPDMGLGPWAILSSVSLLFSLNCPK